MFFVADYLDYHHHSPAYVVRIGSHDPFAIRPKGFDYRFRLPKAKVPWIMDMDILAPELFSSCQLFNFMRNARFATIYPIARLQVQAGPLRRQSVLFQLGHPFFPFSFFVLSFFWSNRFVFEVFEESWKRVKTLPNDECHFCRPHKFIQCILGTITLRPTHPRNCPEATVSHFPTYSHRMGRLYAIWKGILFST